MYLLKPNANDRNTELDGAQTFPRDGAVSWLMFTIISCWRFKRDFRRRLGNA